MQLRVLIGERQFEPVVGLEINVQAFQKLLLNFFFFLSFCKNFDYGYVSLLLYPFLLHCCSFFFFFFLRYTTKQN